MRVLSACSFPKTQQITALLGQPAPPQARMATAIQATVMQVRPFPAESVFLEVVTKCAQHEDLIVIDIADAGDCWTLVETRMSQAELDELLSSGADDEDSDAEVDEQDADEQPESVPDKPSNAELVASALGDSDSKPAPGAESPSPEKVN